MKLQLISVIPSLFSSDQAQYGWLVNLPYTLELISQNLQFHFGLDWLHHMLKMAAATNPKIGAGRDYPLR